MLKNSPLPEISREDWCIALWLFLIDAVGFTGCQVAEFNCFIVLTFDKQDPDVYKKVTEVKNLLNAKPSEEQPPRWSAQTTGFDYSLLVDVPIQYHVKNVHPSKPQDEKQS